MKIKIIKKISDLEKSLKEENNNSINEKKASVPIIKNSDFQLKENDGIGTPLIKSVWLGFLAIERDLNQIRTLKEFSNEFKYNFALNLEKLELSLKKLFLERNNFELDKKTADKFTFQVLNSIKERFHIQTKNIDLFFDSKRKVIELKDVRNGILHATEMDPILFKIQEDLNKDVHIKTRFRHLLNDDKNDENYLLEKLLTKVKEKDLINSTTKKEDLLIYFTELREIMVWYMLVKNKEAQDIEYSDVSIEHLNKNRRKEFNEDSMIGMRRINFMRNNFFHTILDNFDIKKEDYNKIIDIKIKDFIKKMEVEVMRNSLQDFVVGVLKIELKDSKKDSLTNKPIDTEKLKDILDLLDDEFKTKQSKEIQKLFKEIDENYKIIEEKNPFIRK